MLYNKNKKKNFKSFYVIMIWIENISTKEIFNKIKQGKKKLTSLK